MHIPDGFLSAPINGATALASVGFCAAALRVANRTLGEREVPLLGVTGAFIFAAQMINFPVAGGTSGHFLGAALATILLGPWSGGLVMAMVLTVQCLLFADGGITALGSNVFNTSIVGCFSAYALFHGLRALLPKNQPSFLIASAFAAWGSIVVASAACAVELGLSGTSPLSVALPAMVLIHALIGIGEGLITAMVLLAVLVSRPDLLPASLRPARVTA